MDFNEKIKLIEQARRDYPAFDNEFKDYLGLGHSFNGAYNHFSIEDINKHKPVTKVEAAKKEPVKVTAAPKVEATKTITATTAG